MGLVYTELSDIYLPYNKGITVQDINSIFGKLLENDNSMVWKNGNSPALWECTWLNNSGIRGYQKGAAVWLNTESKTDILNKRENDILKYAAFYPSVHRKLMQLRDEKNISDYQQLLFDFTFAEGQFKGSMPVFFPGELTNRVQIRVSKTDDNKQLPDDDNYWEDFFVFYKTSDVQAVILSVFEDTVADKFTEHIEQYHLSGMYSSNSQIADKYLLNDFSNITGQQTFKNHQYRFSNTTGFDGIKTNVIKKNPYNCCKWFKIWNSGVLEHGGIIDIRYLTDKDSIQDGLVTIHFDWTYDGGAQAPTYDYPSDGFANFYNYEKQIDLREKTYIIENPYLGYVYRYTISITPIGGADKMNPYSDNISDNIRETIETYSINNDRFSFFSTSLTDIYSYHVIGYSVKGSNNR